MKKSILILTLMVAALCGCAAQQPTTLETPESSVLVEVTPETGSEATRRCQQQSLPQHRLPPQPRLRNLPQLLLRLLRQLLPLCSRRRHRSKYP